MRFGECKIGDKVKVMSLGEGSDYNIGEIYTVAEVTNNLHCMLKCKLGNIGNYIQYKHLKKVKVKIKKYTGFRRIIL